MNKYYYFVSSLPMLLKNTKPLITVEQFLIQAKQLLEECDFCKIDELNKNIPNLDFFCENVATYLKWNIALKNELVKIRAEKLKIDESKYLVEADSNPFAKNIAVEILKIDSPLLLEKRLDDCRWDFLENLKQGHYYDLDIVLIYFLQLELAERNFKFDSKKGRDNYIQLYKDITGDIYEN